MAITYPRSDILTLTGFVPPFTFDMAPRQELSRLAGGSTIGKDFGPALWAATYTTEDLRNDVMLDYQAVLASLDGVIRTFEAWDLRRPAPRLHPGGVGANDGTLHSVAASQRALSLAGLNAGQTISRGDYLSFTYGTNRALHQAMETVVANSNGITTEFEVRPFIRPGFALDAAVSLKAPRGLFTLLPGTVEPRQATGKHGSLTFQAGQYLE